ncbi:MAG TPA: Uma2 family endonuclease, partial [Isosphaeraceae bacterium]|nr:Uma2 family endonuclease [Isosphaeraceae bacterium]
MSLTATEVVRYTPEQYLARERKAEVRSQYVDGGIFEMHRSNRWHCLIAGNLLATISSRILVSDGEVYGGGMRIHVGQASLYTYSDVVAVVGEPIFEDEVFDTLLNPTLI